MKKALLKSLAVIVIAFSATCSFAEDEGFTTKIEPLSMLKAPAAQADWPGVDLVIANFLPVDASAPQQNGVAINLVDYPQFGTKIAPAQASFRILNPGYKDNTIKVTLKAPDSTIFFSEWVFHRATISVKGYSRKDVVVTEYKP